MDLLRRFIGEDLATETTNYALVVGFIALGSATVVSAESGSVTSCLGTINTAFTTLFGTT